MFSVSRHELNDYASQTGFLINPLEKALRLINVLSTLNEHPFLCNKFVLKGGTALNLFYFNLPRLSIDIDLNYTAFLKVGEMRKDKQMIITEIESVFASEYSVEISQDKHVLTQFFFRYRTLSGSSDMLKVEINYLHRQPILTPVKRKCRMKGTNLEFECLDFVELSAGKIAAMLERYTSRDLFDIYQIANHLEEKHFDALKSLLLYYSIIKRPTIFDLYQLKFDQIGQSDIKNHLIPMLSKRGFLDRESLIRKVEDFIQPLLQLSEKQIKGISEFYRLGQINLTDLIAEDTLCLEIAKSPALQWRVKNIINYRKKHK
ncbi:MAG: nucleotidyl transferase AbiEii/AbiGii toxin family protein [Candidatus Marinimicrobia bacterium]|nr:nucleotidyl transferase AbiEii/AbiGii toxin family protein [Candidatus Neomarinimicrobiota bacterium]